MTFEGFAWKLMVASVLALVNTAGPTNPALSAGKGVKHEEAHPGVVDGGGPDDGDAGDERRTGVRRTSASLPLHRPQRGHNKCSAVREREAACTNKVAKRAAAADGWGGKLKPRYLPLEPAADMLDGRTTL
jgi:hypothetical protein